MSDTEYFEDISVGDRRSFGERTITRDDIVEFAREYDPQPIHTDEGAAAETMMGGLIASGWHTASVCMRLMIDNMSDRALVAARGIDELRWIRPVRPGDTLTVEVEVLETSAADGRNEIGYVDERLTGYNQDGEAVISWISLEMVSRRESLENGSETSAE
ncbi:MaoC family dehydratase [Natronobiforma cellulositropha]|uniref:MaoC family dehydratase n=1 Tax=Natronobiforma cellulositropha TaxID=1679076 RepID=UPI0021D57295|nr:MaoC family dehydratase [Natronobiforma cellulositropha]